MYEDENYFLSDKRNKIFLIVGIAMIVVYAIYIISPEIPEINFDFFTEEELEEEQEWHTVYPETREMLDHINSSLSNTSYWEQIEDIKVNPDGTFSMELNRSLINDEEEFDIFLRVLFNSTHMDVNRLSRDIVEVYDVEINAYH